MNHTKTDRGFTLIEFTDANGDNCTLQDSSRMACEGEDWQIWLGIDSPTISTLPSPAGVGWKVHAMADVKAAIAPEAAHMLFSGRMHLTQSMVRDLLPMLAHFAEHGELPEVDE